MKTTTPAVLDTITNDHANEVSTVMHAEWQMNRFYNTVADNTPSEDFEGFDIEYFPIESITESNRPTSGICKAVVGQSFVESRYHDTVPSARFYTVDADDEYQYWQSPVSASTTGIFPIFNATNFPTPEGETYVYDNLTSVRPQVTYVTEDDANGNSVPILLQINKITYTVETTFAKPVDYDVQVRYTTSGAWTTVATDLAVPVDGRVQLWYNGTGWTTTPDYDNTATASAVRLVVRSMNKQAYLNLIELGFCLERDMTSDLVAWNDSFNMGEVDFITPLGQISSNGGQVTLFNGYDGTYRNNNQDSLYFGILDKGVIFRCWMQYGATRVQEFEMFSEVWDEADDQTTITLVDGSGFFMDTKPRAVLYRDIPVQEAIWRICDIVGFTNYNVTTIDETANIDIFWTDGEKTAWEIFGELSRATQTAIYFDSYGTLQIKTRDAAWEEGQAPAFNFTRDSVPGGQPANIVSLNESTEYEANKVTVNWQQTGFSETRDNIVPFEVVWEPEGSLVMRATPLARSLLIGHEVIYLRANEGKTWPWKGMMNLEGEWISYDAKQYVHYENGVRKGAWIKDHDEQKKLDARAGTFYRHLNHYTGALRVEQRGLWGTHEANHRIDLQNWGQTRRRNHNNNTTNAAGIKLNTSSSTVTIEGHHKFSMNDYTYLHRGNTVDRGYKYLGVRMKIDRGAWRDKAAGIFFASDGGLGSGYYLEVMATARMDGKMRNQRNEVMFYSMRTDGSKKVFGGESIRMKDKSKNHKKKATTKKDIGSRLAVPMDRFIDFDIWFHKGAERDTVQIFANGRKLMDAQIDGVWRHANVAGMGLFARGHSKATFDYVYAINSPGVELIDSESYFDRIDGGYYSTQAADWTYGTREARRKVKKRRRKRRKGRKWKWKWVKYTKRYGQRFYDEFGPVAHEIRQFEVKFESSLPVLESKLYFSNTSQVVCTEFTGDIKGANFLMANISRLPAVLSGDDERTAMGNGTINHKLFVYGRPVIQKDSQEIIKEDAWAIRRRGPIEVEYASPWIQNEEEAERFGTWLTTHWTGSDSKLDVEVFGNPLMELGDTVHVKYNHIDALFWVVGISNSYEPGLSTSLTLRKARDLS